MFRKISIAFAAMLFLSIAGIASTAGAQSFDDSVSISDTGLRSAGASAVSNITVSAPFAVTKISTLNSVASSHNQRFFIYNLTTATMVYITTSKPFLADAASTFTFKDSDTFAAVTLQPGTTYYIGSIADQPTYYAFNVGPLTQGTVTSNSSNGNFSNYASPTPINSGGARMNLRLNPAPAAAPVPTMSEWAMILMGLMLAGGATVMMQRRRMTV